MLILWKFNFSNSRVPRKMRHMPPRSPDACLPHAAQANASTFNPFAIHRSTA